MLTRSERPDGEVPFGQSNRAMSSTAKETKAVGIRKVSRRGVIATALAASVASTLHGEERKVSKPATWDSVVIGAGVFGAWTAWHLRKAGQRVLLLDAFGAAHARCVVWR